MDLTTALWIRYKFRGCFHSYRDHLNIAEFITNNFIFYTEVYRITEFFIRCNHRFYDSFILVSISPDIYMTLGCGASWAYLSNLNPLEYIDQVLKGRDVLMISRKSYTSLFLTNSILIEPSSCIQKASIHSKYKKKDNWEQNFSYPQSSKLSICAAVYPNFS